MGMKETSVRAEKLAVLKDEVEGIFGRKIVSSRDCIELSADILKKTGHSLNVNTLRRFFGLVSYNNFPSKTTLDILSGYCGYIAFEHVHDHGNHQEENNHIPKDSVVHFLTSLFGVEIKDKNDPVFISLVKETIGFLNRNPHLKKPFHIEIAKTKNGQELYFERFVNIDGLNSFYGDGLRAYLNEKRTTEGGIFAHSLLAFRYWLTSDKQRLERHGTQIRNYSLPLPLSTTIAARYFAALLFLTTTGEQGAEELLSEARTYYENAREMSDQGQAFSSFELVFGQALALIGFYEESLFYFSNAKEKYIHNRTQRDEPLAQSLNLWKAFSLYQLNEEEEAEQLLNKIRPENFYFLSKKLETTIYLILRSAFKNANANFLLQINGLISDTGYIKLNDFIKDLVQNEQN